MMEINGDPVSEDMIVETIQEQSEQKPKRLEVEKLKSSIYIGTWRNPLLLDFLVVTLTMFPSRQPYQEEIAT